jgi:hypothetical protein
MSCRIRQVRNLFEAVRQPSPASGTVGRALTVTCLCGALLLLVFHTTAMGAGPCTCDDIDKMQKHLDRVANAEEAWKEIFAWARELYRDVDLPQSNDDLNQKFVQLTGASKAQWYDLIKQGPVKEKKTIKKVAGVSPEGEPVVDDDFKKSNCDDIINAEHVHEQAHKDFYLSFPKVFDVLMSSRLLRLRAESEVESYRKHKAFLEKTLSELKLKCTTKLDPSKKRELEQAAAQRQRMNEAEIRVRLLGAAQSGK